VQYTEGTEQKMRSSGKKIYAMQMRYYAQAMRRSAAAGEAQAELMPESPLSDASAPPRRRLDTPSRASPSARPPAFMPPPSPAGGPHASAFFFRHSRHPPPHSYLLLVPQPSMASAILFRHPSTAIPAAHGFTAFHPRLRWHEIEAGGERSEQRQSPPFQAEPHEPRLPRRRATPCCLPPAPPFCR